MKAPTIVPLFDDNKSPVFSDDEFGDIDFIEDRFLAITQECLKDAFNLDVNFEQIQYFNHLLLEKTRDLDPDNVF